MSENYDGVLFLDKGFILQPVGFEDENLPNVADAETGRIADITGDIPQPYNDGREMIPKHIISEDECAAFKPILKDFTEAWAKDPGAPTEKWLSPKLQEYMPEKDPAEIKTITSEIISSIETSEKAKKSLGEAIANGRSKESWFASQVQGATSGMSAHEASAYLADLDTAVNNANEELRRTITTNSGMVNRNPSLDGFIAEQYHAQTFNMNAEATGSQYRAEVCEPNGTTYGKNSVDIVIKDSDGNIVRRYQCKYYKDAKSTENAYNSGDYRGQRRVVPDGQEGDVKGGSNVIEAPDGTKSNPLSKEKAEQMRDEAQSGKWNDLNWNEYKTKDIAIGIGRQAGNAAIQGMAIGAGMDIASKLWNGEEIRGDEVVENALKSGADFGLKAAAGGALKVGVEKGIITAIPKGTPAGTITNIAYVAIEDLKIVGKMATGEYTFKEGVDKIQQTTVAVAGGLVAMGKGAAIGAGIGAFAGPVGAAIGGFVGGTIGYMAGSKVGEAVVKTYQKTRDRVVETVKKIGNRVREKLTDIGETIKNNPWSVLT